MMTDVIYLMIIIVFLMVIVFLTTMFQLYFSNRKEKKETSILNHSLINHIRIYDIINAHRLGNFPFFVREGPYQNNTQRSHFSLELYIDHTFIAKLKEDKYFRTIIHFETGIQSQRKFILDTLIEMQEFSDMKKKEEKDKEVSDSKREKLRTQTNAELALEKFLSTKEK